MEQEYGGNADCNWCVGNKPQRLDKRIRRVGNHKTSWDNPNYNIVDIGQNIKTLRNLKRHAVIQTSVKDYGDILFEFLLSFSLVLHHQVEMKEKIQKEYLKRTRKLLETKLSCRNLIKGINTKALSLVRYSGPFLKLTRDILKQMDQRTKKKLMTNKALHPRDDVNRLYVSRKRKEKDLPASKTALTHRYNGSKSTYKNTIEDWLQPSEKIPTTQLTIEWQKLENKKKNHQSRNKRMQQISSEGI